VREMAYSDYGGYAYRNGILIKERSDAVLTTEGIQSTPGMWPGFVIPEGRTGGSFHVLLGDGKVLVGLYKQSHVAIYKDGEEIKLVDLLPVEGIKTYGEDSYVDSEYYKESGLPCIVTVDDYQIEIYWEETDNHYQYVRLTQPDGNIWTGFSGYGVGMGLEDAGYGFSTSQQEERLQELFKD